MASSPSTDLGAADVQSNDEPGKSSSNPKKKTFEEIVKALMKKSSSPNSDLAEVWTAMKLRDQLKQKENFDEAIYSVLALIDANIHQHRLACKFFGARQFWFFTFTQALLTLTASVLAFWTGENESRTKFVAGICSALVVFLQTLSGTCNYGTRAAMHEAVVIDLRNLREELFLVMARNDLGSTHIDTGAADSADSKTGTGKAKNNEKPISSFGEIELRFKQSITGCKSVLPNEITVAFSSIIISDGYDDFILRAFLSSTITESPRYPIFLPNSRVVVDDTFARYYHTIQHVDDLDLEAGH